MVTEKLVGRDLVRYSQRRKVKVEVQAENIEKLWKENRRSVDTLHSSVNLLTLCEPLLVGMDQESTKRSVNFEVGILTLEEGGLELFF